MTRGRYCLNATLWLARRLREGDAARRLRVEWQIRRRVETGKGLADARRSFRAAVESAERVNDRLLE